MFIITADLNECLDQTDLCDQHCTNTPGSYVCDCNPGYELDPNRFTCIGEYCAMHYLSLKAKALCAFKLFRFRC